MRNELRQHQPVTASASRSLSRARSIIYFNVQIAPAADHASMSWLLIQISRFRDRRLAVIDRGGGLLVQESAVRECVAKARLFST
jgi:hypothetical protein